MNEKPGYCIHGIRRKEGVILKQALIWNVRTCYADEKGEFQAADPQERAYQCSMQGRKVP
jgi:hypothetical protein